MCSRNLIFFIWVTALGLLASSAWAQDARRGRRGDRQDNGVQQDDQERSGERQRGQRGDWGRDRRGDRGQRTEGDADSRVQRGPWGRDRGVQRGPGDRDSADRGVGDRGFGQRGPGGPGNWPGRGGPPREFTAEEREQFYSRMMEGQLERLSRNYELTEPQKQQVQSKLEERRVQQRTFTEQRGQEFQALRQEMWQMRESGNFDPQKAREIGQKFESLRRDSPLFNSDAIATEVESMLPADQVERGRARREAESAERERRREEWRRDWEQRRQQGDTGQGRWPGMRRPEGDQSEAGQAGDQESGRRGWGDRGDRRRGRGDDDQGRGRSSSQVTEQVASGQPDAIKENPVGPWEQYLKDFVRHYGLDPAQQATAESVLREVLERRTTYEQSHRLDYEQANKIAGSSDRQKRLDELNAPVVGMFEELKRRLMRIPSSMQLQTAGVRTTTTQPAADQTRQTRPAATGS